MCGEPLQLAFLSFFLFVFWYLLCSKYFSKCFRYITSPYPSHYPSIIMLHTGKLITRWFHFVQDLDPTLESRVCALQHLTLPPPFGFLGIIIKKWDLANQASQWMHKLGREPDLKPNT